MPRSKISQRQVPNGGHSQQAIQNVGGVSPKNVSVSPQKLSSRGKIQSPGKQQLSISDMMPAATKAIAKITKGQMSQVDQISKSKHTPTKVASSKGRARSNGSARSTPKIEKPPVFSKPAKEEEEEQDEGEEEEEEEENEDKQLSSDDGTHEQPNKIPASSSQLQPKRYQTGYFLFCNSHRTQFVSQQPDISMVECTKLMALQWKAMSEEEKAPYQKMHEEDKVRYEKDKEMLQIKGYFITKDGQKSCDLPANSPLGSKVKKPKQQKVVEMPVVNKQVDMTYYPPKTVSAWCYFNQAHHTNIREANKAKGIRDIGTTIRQVAQMWKECSPEEKAKYLQMQQEDQDRHHAQTEEMQKNGYFLLEDGTKSSEYEVLPKIKKGKRGKPEPEQHEEAPIENTHSEKSKKRQRKQ